MRLVLNPGNAGFARACNQGLALADGDMLVLLNDDTLVTPGWLPRLIAPLRDPAIGLAGAVTNRIGNEARSPPAIAPGVSCGSSPPSAPAPMRAACSTSAP